MTSAQRARRGRFALVLGCTAGLVVAGCTSGPSTPAAKGQTTTTAGTGTVSGGRVCSTDDTRSFQLSGPLPTPGQMPAGSKMEEIWNRGKLRVGVSADTLQFGARNPITDRIEGFDIDMLKEVARAIFGANLSDDEVYERLDIKVITYAQRIPSLQGVDADGKAVEPVDLVAHTMTINDCRWERIYFSTEYYRSYQKVLVRRNLELKAGERDTRTIKDPSIGTVCVAKGSTNVEKMKEPEYERIPRREVDDLTECLLLFQQGKVGAITGDDTVLAGFKKQDPYATIIDDKLSEEPYGLGIGDGYSHKPGNLERTTPTSADAAADQVQFVRFVNGVLDKMRSDGTWKRIYNEWLGEAFGKDAPSPQAEYGRPEPAR